MPEIDPLMLVLGGAAASGLLILLAVGMAYRLGRDRGLRSRSDRFDRLYVEAAFGNTHWTVCDTSDAVTAKVVGTMSLYQSGTRVMAEGIDSQHRRWSAEGVAFRRGVHLLFVERRERGHAVGALHLSLDTDGLFMTGMKSTWEGDQPGGAIQTVVWHRTPARVTLAANADVDIQNHETTSGGIPQQLVNVYRPVDRLATEVVTVSPVPSHCGF